MVESKRNTIDPSPVIQKVIDIKSGISLGKQQDIGEFHDTFLKKVEEEFIKEEDPTKLFYGTYNENLQYLNGDSQEKVSKTSCDFTNLILNVSKDLNNLYSSMDDYTSIENVDYTREDGVKVEAKKSTWFRKLPKVLIIQLQRIEYDKEKKTLKKINLPFSFDKTIYLDRYLEDNMNLSLEKREKYQNIKKEINEYEQKLNNEKNYNNKGLSKVEILTSTLEILFEGQIFNDDVQKTGDYINYLLNQSIERISTFDFILKDKKTELDQIFFSMMKSSYKIHSILVHQGNVESGHYFSFIHQNDKWFKCNDETVTEIPEKEVLELSTGGKDDSSAYCLIYYDESESELSVKNYKSWISIENRNKVNEDNIKLGTEIDECQKMKKKEEEEILIKFSKEVKKVYEEMIDNYKRFDERKRDYETLTNNSLLNYRIHEFDYSKLDIADKLFNKYFPISFSQLTEDKLKECQDALGISHDVHFNSPKHKTILKYREDYIQSSLFYGEALYQEYLEDFEKSALLFHNSLYFNENLPSEISRKNKILKNMRDVLIKMTKKIKYQIHTILKNELMDQKYEDWLIHLIELYPICYDPVESLLIYRPIKESFDSCLYKFSTSDVSRYCKILDEFDKIKDKNINVKELGLFSVTLTEISPIEAANRILKLEK